MQRLGTDSTGQSAWVNLVGKSDFRFVLDSPSANDNGTRFRAWVWDSVG